MSDIYGRMLKEQQALKQLVDPLYGQHQLPYSLDDAYKQLGIGAETIRFMQEDEERRRILAGIGDIKTFTDIAEEAERQRKIWEGPLRETRLTDFRAQFDLGYSSDAATQAIRTFENSFRLPGINEVDQLARYAMGAESLAKKMLDGINGNSIIQAAMAGMQNPWMSIEHAEKSASGLASILALGHGLDEQAPFNAGFSDVLRPSLGDWRDVASFPEELFQNPILRVGVYHERGFDPALTDFTIPAFDECLWRAGLSPRPSTNKKANGEQDEHKNGLVHSLQAFKILQHFEVAIRKFIVRVMSTSYGTEWARQGLPNGMLESWKAKQETAIKAGQQGQALIDYADFTDYRKIIERKQNWETIFRTIFVRVEDVRESLQRLHPSRIATMHARPVALEDLLLTQFETKRVLKAIKNA
jgi:hypothetical protein